MEQIVGEGNESIININKVPTSALIDSGSMISTCTEEFLEQLRPKPEILPLEDFELEIKVAGGYSLPYKGYTFVEVTVPFLSNEELNVPMLVVPQTEYNKMIPVVVGTNIIRQFSDIPSETKKVASAWKVAINAICSKQAGTVKTTNKITLQPLESKVVTGFVRKDSNVETALTEPAENGSTSRVMICPRVVNLNKPGKSARVPVRIFNISARVVTIPAKSNLCDLNEVHVLRSADLNPTSTSEKVATINQQSVNTSQVKDVDGIDLTDPSLSEVEKQQAKQFLSKWQHIFSQGPLDLGHTRTVKHEIHLEDETPFKQPYRHIPPALFQEVREHLREMLQIGAIRESSSPFSSNVVLVRKKDGTIRYKYKNR